MAPSARPPRAGAGRISSRFPAARRRDVVAAVREGRAEAGCLPIENSLIGSVTTTYDLLEEAFGDGTLRLTHEILYPVHHALMATPGSTLDGIKRVLSHPVALGQCRIWLERNLPEVELVSAWDTAGSAEIVAKEGNPALCRHRRPPCRGPARAHRPGRPDRGRPDQPDPVPHLHPLRRGPAPRRRRRARSATRPRSSSSSITSPGCWR